jgi:hypothetical protein
MRHLLFFESNNWMPSIQFSPGAGHNELLSPSCLPCDWYKFGLLELVLCIYTVREICFKVKLFIKMQHAHTSIKYCCQNGARTHNKLSIMLCKHNCIWLLRWKCFIYGDCVWYRCFGICIVCICNENKNRCIEIQLAICMSLWRAILKSCYYLVKMSNILLNPYTPARVCAWMLLFMYVQSGGLCLV